MNKWQSHINIFSLLLGVSRVCCAKATGRLNCSYSLTDVQSDLVRMRLKVRLEACRIAELLPAQDARDLLVAEDVVLVNAHVSTHVAAAVEQSQADGTRERLEAGVDEPVLLETRRGLERFAADVARERPVRRMDGRVQAQVKQKLVRLAAGLADVRPLARVYSHVTGQRPALTERTTAHGALVSHLSGVTLHVHVQIRQTFERPRTHGACDFLRTDCLYSHTLSFRASLLVKTPTNPTFSPRVSIRSSSNCRWQSAAR